MNRFVIFLFLISSFICGSNCVDFCDAITMDVVYNIGRLVYIGRCGEVWTWDPQYRKGRGGFIRDYSVHTLAKDLFAKNIADQNNNEFDIKNLRYTAFSFQEIECEDLLYDIERDCQVSAMSWNSWSVIADNRTYGAFLYFSTGLIQFREKKDDPWPNNPMGLPVKVDYNTQSVPFWPDITTLDPHLNFRNKKYMIQASLFLREEYRLFLGVLMAEDQKTYCITYLNMRDMILDSRKWPSFVQKDNKSAVLEWAPPYCFQGHLVGMFARDGQAYVVGRVLYQTRYYEDQVYGMKAGDQSVIQITPVNIPHWDQPHNLRTFFGCDVEEPYRVYTTKQVTTPSTTTPVPDSGRKKRSVEESEPFIQMIWDDMKKELREDWILLSFMSSIALLMIYIIHRNKE